jgi:UrcA family protein
MNAMQKRVAVLALSAAASVGFTASAQSQTAQERTTIAPVSVVGDSIRVSYADLNLASEDGMDRLGARIYRASAEVCQLTDQPLIQQMDRLSCMNTARRDAFTQLAAKRSTALASTDQALVLDMDKYLDR